jgi:carbohydrate-selective porin OprB
MMPTVANGATFDRQIEKAQGSNLELTLKPNDSDTVIRILTYLNRGRMGNYDEALAIGQDTSSIPDVRADEKPGRTKYGFGLNFEQPITDKGETGIFGRLGWNDGHNENFCYTEVDRTASLGIQVNGVHWGREVDQVGIGYAFNGLSPEHKNYLAAGGFGFLLGDGRLNYGLEQILETYYRIQIGKYVQISPDFQFIQNPAYNRDRGPVEVYSMRLRLSY